MVVAQQLRGQARGRDDARRSHVSRRARAECSSSLVAAHHAHPTSDWLRVGIQNAEKTLPTQAAARGGHGAWKGLPRGSPQRCGAAEDGGADVHRGVLRPPIDEEDKHMNILGWIVLGGLAGWLASTLVRGGGLGIVGDILVGIVGAFIGGFIVYPLGGSRYIGLYFLWFFVVVVWAAVLFC